jgi:hypothetical protein
VTAEWRDALDREPDWSALVQAEPRLADLALEAVAQAGEGAWCRWRWYERELKPRVELLVGWGAHYREGAPPVLTTPAAYETAVAYLTDLLPPCRGCHD